MENHSGCIALGAPSRTAIPETSRSLHCRQLSRGPRLPDRHPHCNRLRAPGAVTQQLDNAITEHGINWQDGFEELYDCPGVSLGSGSFGDVFLAVDRRTGRRVAVKDMPKTRGRLGEERTKARVDREVAVMKALGGCAGVVGTLGCFRARGGRYRIVMEYLGGKDLKQHLKENGPFSELQVILVAYEILKVIRACHYRNIVHGDVKTANFVLKSPSCNPLKQDNISLLKSGWLKAVDFGCSQFADEFARLRMRVGTPVFMAPEVFRRNYSFESDLWSLGILLYQLTTSRFPFWDTEDKASVCTVSDVMESIDSRDPSFDYGPWLTMSSEGLDFIQSLLDKNYATRMSVDEAANHPWIKNHVHNDNQGDVVVNNIVPTGAALADEEFVGSTPTYQYCYL